MTETYTTNELWKRMQEQMIREKTIKNDFTEQERGRLEAQIESLEKEVENLKSNSFMWAEIKMLKEQRSDLVEIIVESRKLVSDAQYELSKAIIVEEDIIP
jgi:hypothetical protein